MQSLKRVSSGIESFDKITDGLRYGDNVVWQLDDIGDYSQFVHPFAGVSLAQNKRLVYMRFAKHEPILSEDQYSVMYELDAFGGFETFSTEIHRIIRQEGVGIFYVFDCLSDLQSFWATDMMIGNFFRITCPYLFELDTVAYFAILKNSVSFKTIARIRETTQLLIDVYNIEGSYYVHPLKVWNRYTPTMFFPHLKSKDDLKPITNSVDVSRLMSHVLNRDSENVLRNLDYWDRLFLRAEEMIVEGAPGDEQRKMVGLLSKILISRDEHVLEMVERQMSLGDLVEIKKRQIGTGYIGGKAIGMILSRKILTNSSPSYDALLEPHDSFYIGSDVFYTYLVQNGWWKLFMDHKTEEGYFKAAEVLYENMHHGTFPDMVKEQFQQIIEYFGQSPFIVRSSSLLEDAFGNAFAGKYDSFFLVNQGSPEERYDEFLNAVRKVYASTMNEDALTYRLQRRLDKLDEQMALLVQRVSGSYYGNFFFPDMAGVGLSYNAYVWKNTLDPAAGMLRLVFGLGTRAVNRVEGDYPRIIALDDPMLKPYAGGADARKFSQRYLDLLNIPENELQTVSVPHLTKEQSGVRMELVGERDFEIEERLRMSGHEDTEYWVINFDRVLSETPFVSDMQSMLKTLESVYEYPVDIEFTVNFGADDSYHVNLLQCRPEQTRSYDNRVEIPDDIEKKRIFFQSQGNFLGGSVSRRVKRIIFVDPLGYGELPLTQKYDVARIVGKINKKIRNRDEVNAMLLGPGRWGTTTPSLGIPVTFSEINNISILVEIALMRDNLIPELSYGTHFFQDLVETDIFYIALFPEKGEVIFNQDWLAGHSNQIDRILPEDSRYHHIVRVYDIEEECYVLSSLVAQKVVCFA